MTKQTRNWTIDDLKTQLGLLPKAKGWIITEEDVYRRERYFLSEGERLAVDQDRSIRSKNIILRLFVEGNQPARQGEITKKLSPALPLQEQLELTQEAAGQTDYQAWELPTSLPAQLPSLKTTDPDMAEDLAGVMSRVSTQIQEAVEKKREARFCSAELFLSLHDRIVHCSNGLKHRSSQSRIYGEAAFAHAKKLPIEGTTLSDEYLNSTWSVNLKDFSVEKLFQDAAERACRSLEVVKPVTGSYSVIIDAEVLSELLNGCLSQFSASSAYHGLPFLKPGGEFIPGCEGDLLTITLDPSLDFGPQTLAVSEQGIPQTPLRLVEENQILGTAADKQYADYLAIQPTTQNGNLVVNPGSLSYEELTRLSPLVVEVLQFSGLFTDPISGTFSSEIRLARLYDQAQNKTVYLKGGSLSGSVMENFKGLRLSNERVKKSHFNSESVYGRGYYGPEYALLTQVSIVG